MATALQQERVPDHSAPVLAPLKQHEHAANQLDLSGLLTVMLE